MRHLSFRLLSIHFQHYSRIFFFVLSFNNFHHLSFILLQWWLYLRLIIAKCFSVYVLVKMKTMKSTVRLKHLMLHFICFAHLYLSIHMNIYVFKYYISMVWHDLVITIIPKRHESLDSYLYNTQRFTMWYDV